MSWVPRRVSFLDSGALKPGGPCGKARLFGRVGRKVLDLLAEGRSAASVAHDLDVRAQTIYNWRRQEGIDRGEIDGVTTQEQAELAQAKKRIAQLETELAVATRAVDLLKEQTRPQGRLCSIRHPRLGRALLDGALGTLVRDSDRRGCPLRTRQVTAQHPVQL